MLKPKVQFILASRESSSLQQIIPCKSVLYSSYKTVKCLQGYVWYVACGQNENSLTQCIICMQLNVASIHVPDIMMQLFRNHLYFISERELKFTFAICHRRSVCRLWRSCALLRRLKFSAMFLRHRVRWPPVDIQVKFYEDRPRGTPPSGELNRRGVAEYSDFGPIDGYISETVQDRRYVTINH